MTKLCSCHKSYRYTTFIAWIKIIVDRTFCVAFRLQCWIISIVAFKIQEKLKLFYCQTIRKVGHAWLNLSVSKPWELVCLRDLSWTSFFIIDDDALVRGKETAKIDANSLISTLLKRKKDGSTLQRIISDLQEKSLSTFSLKSLQDYYKQFYNRVSFNSINSFALPAKPRWFAFLYITTLLNLLLVFRN